MSLALDFLNIWKDGFDNKDSSQCGNFMNDDWQFDPSGTVASTRNKQETLDSISAGGNPTIIDNIEILYENDEVAVGTHGNTNGIVMFLLRKREDKFSSIRHIRERTES